MASICMILPSATVKPMIGNVRPRTVITSYPIHQGRVQLGARGAPQKCLTGNGCCATGDPGGRQGRLPPKSERSTMPLRRPLPPAPSSKIRISSRYLGTFDPSACLASWLTVGADRPRDDPAGCRPAM
jgi:hypothetical protein